MRFDVQHFAFGVTECTRTHAHRVAGFLQLQWLVARQQVHRREVALRQRFQETLEDVRHDSARAGCRGRRRNARRGTRRACASSRRITASVISRTRLRWIASVSLEIAENWVWSIANSCESEIVCIGTTVLPWASVRVNCTSKVTTYSPTRCTAPLVNKREPNAATGTANVATPSVEVSSTSTLLARKASASERGNSPPPPTCR